MTKNEFLNHPDSLVIIIMLNPESGKVLFDTYPYDISEMWETMLSKDFPDMLLTVICNKAAINSRINQINGK